MRIARSSSIPEFQAYILPKFKPNKDSEQFLIKNWTSMTGHIMIWRMQLSAAEFKTKCLSLMDMVQETQEEVIITKHGKPVAKLVTIKDNTAARLFGYLKGRIQENEDIVPSLGLRWDADSK